MVPVTPLTPPPPPRRADPPPHKVTRSYAKRSPNLIPRRLTAAKIVTDDVTNLKLGMVLYVKKYTQQQTVVVTTTHTLVLAVDQTIIEIHPNKPHVIGHAVIFDDCF